MNVEGYSFNADTYCEDCTDKAKKDGTLLFDGGCGEWHDSEGNEIHPIFSTDETDTPEHCSDCGAFLDTSWHSETMKYVEEAMIEYIDKHRKNFAQEQIGWRAASQPNADTMDTWRENYGWCIGTNDTLLRIYDKVREREQRYDN
jgi:hypothetical protein